MRQAYAHPQAEVLHRRRARLRQSSSTAMRGVDYVFHAAALKQVPSCEFYPMEAVKTNVLGTENVLNAAIAEPASKRVICLSTDKAVYPINAMGISKAMMEKVMVAKSRDVDADETTFCGTRYGNVMASRGSVIPLFVEQIQEGQPLTVTDPEHDPVHDVARRCGGPGAVCLRARPTRRHLRAEGAGRDHRDAGAGAASDAGSTPDHRDRGHRHPPRRKALRDPADPRGDGPRRGPRRLLPHPGRSSATSTTASISTKGEAAHLAGRGLQLAQHRTARTFAECKELLLRLALRHRTCIAVADRRPRRSSP